MRSLYPAEHQAASFESIIGQRAAQIAFIQRNHPIEALATDGTDEAFAVGVRLGRTRRRPHGPEGHRPECVIDGWRENGVAVVDDESIGRIGRNTIPELLDRPFRRWVVGDVPVHDPPCGNVDEDEHV